jgi:pimeloyl-ACP methyl ester carboxylesterase
MRSPSDAAPLRAPVDDGFFAPVRGAPQWVTMRGADAPNPPLLVLTGPGAAFSRLAPWFSPWEAHFNVVQWDQPGGGATFARGGEMALSLARLAADAEAVAEIVAERLGGSRLVVLGVSGGSIVGLKLAKARPDLVAAYVGTGQIVHWARQQALGYRMALAAAKARGDAAEVAELEAIGAPPYADLAAETIWAKHVGAPTAAERDAFAAMAALGPPPPGARYWPQGLTPPDPRERGAAAYAALRGEIAAFDARALGARFETPLAFVQGEHDLYTATAEVAAWAAGLDAPAVRLEIVSGGGHSAVFLRDAFLKALRAVTMSRSIV